MNQASTLDLGLDVHTESLAVAYVAKEPAADVIDLGPSGTRPVAIDPLIRTVQSNAQPLIVVYEAGPWG